LGRGQLNSSGHAISVDVMPQWTLEYPVFAYDSFVKSGEPIIETQRLFRFRFDIGRHDNIASCNTILRGRGGAVVKAPEGRGFDSRWCRIFSLT
jgi:hypothetical protein